MRKPYRVGQAVQVHVAQLGQAPTWQPGKVVHVEPSPHCHRDQYVTVGLYNELQARLVAGPNCQDIR